MQEAYYGLSFRIKGARSRQPFLFSASSQRSRDRMRPPRRIVRKGHPELRISHLEVFLDHQQGAANTEGPICTRVGSELPPDAAPPDLGLVLVPLWSPAGRNQNVHVVGKKKKNKEFYGVEPFLLSAAMFNWKSAFEGNGLKMASPGC